MKPNLHFTQPTNHNAGASASSQSHRSYFSLQPINTHLFSLAANHHSPRTYFRFQPTTMQATSTSSQSPHSYFHFQSITTQLLPLPANHHSATSASSQSPLRYFRFQPINAQLLPLPAGHVTAAHEQAVGGGRLIARRKRVALEAHRAGTHGHVRSVPHTAVGVHATH